MKDQYFGDINDYRKYGLLRAIARSSGLRILVAWMLTPDDGGADGNFITYLEHPKKWVHHDPDLFHGLKNLLSFGGQRRVSMFEDAGLLLKAEYFSQNVPDAAAIRAQWFSKLNDRAQSFDLVFLDPDNGLEVKSKPYGRRHSSKFLYWHEVKALWASGKSLLVYQHFIREKRITFIERMLEVLRGTTPGSFVEAFSTPHVVFLMALQPEHQGFHEDIVRVVQKQWAGQIHHWELTRAQQKTPTAAQKRRAQEFDR